LQSTGSECQIYIFKVAEREAEVMMSPAVRGLIVVLGPDKRMKTVEIIVIPRPISSASTIAWGSLRSIHRSQAITISC